MQSFGLAGTQKLRVVRAGLGESWVRLTGKSLFRDRRDRKTSQRAP